LPHGDVVVEHALGKVLLGLTLNLDMDEQPALGAVAQPHFEELVGQALTYLGPADDLLKLLVERFVAALPVDVGVNVGKEEGEEERQVDVQRILPRAVEIVRRFATLGHAADYNAGDGRGQPCCRHYTQG